MKTGMVNIVDEDKNFEIVIEFKIYCKFKNPEFCFQCFVLSVEKQVIDDL
jgi:hypothetical protein